MKHLKRYNESFSERMTTEEINIMLDTIEDIFLDIKDDGFRLDYSGTVLNLSITKPKQTVLGDMGVKFNVSDISNTDIHLYNYLSTINKLDFVSMELISNGLNKHSITIDELISQDNLYKQWRSIDRFVMKYNESFLKKKNI